MMKSRLASWTAFGAAFIASGLALRVAFKLGVDASLGTFNLLSELQNQSRWAAVAALAALVSAIAQIIEKASR
jgi:hypothetical protein